MNIIMKQAIGISLLMVCSLLSIMGRANNIAVTNLVRLNQAAGSYQMVRFNISWTNSWRNDITNQASPFNYDAAWVFMKWRTNDPSAGITSDWRQASLSTNAADHVAPVGSRIEVGLNGRPGEWGAKGVGVFIYRSENGNGVFTADKVRLRWNHAADGMADNAQVELKVCAIEMVYVSTGAFYVGTASGGNEDNRFYAGGSSDTTPFQITNENYQIEIANEIGKLYSTSNNNYAGDRTGILSNAFPKGFNAFYVMKYKITQSQYVDFLNTLTRDQQTNHFASTNLSLFLSGSAVPTCRNGVQLYSDPGVPNPRLYVNNLDTNNIPNSTNDGQWIACNYLDYEDFKAYLDWAGLRPISELEYEKACRGTNIPVQRVYPWGDTTITQATGIINSGQANEAPSNADANSNYKTTSFTNTGPMRVGCFGIGTGTRTASGAGYYGVMEMAGNLNERLITVGIPQGRTFSGQHGDGILTTDGHADVNGWPASDALGFNIRGFDYTADKAYLKIADRALAAYSGVSYRHNAYGGRGCRSAP